MTKLTDLELKLITLLELTASEIQYGVFASTTPSTLYFIATDDIEPLIFPLKRKHSKQIERYQGGDH